jgi:hypothetical protein
MARNTRRLNHNGKARPLVAKLWFIGCNREFFKAIGFEKQWSAGRFEKSGN